MEKVRLMIDELQVESFNTSDDPSQHRGTVNGYENPTDEVDCTAFDASFALSCACNIVQSDVCTDDEWLRYAATFIGSGT